MYVGHRGRRIEVITQTLIHDPNTTFIRLEGELAKIPPEVLKRDYEVVQGHITPRISSTPRVAIIGSFGTNCGMSTYCDYLVRELAGLTREIKVFAELDNAAVSDPRVLRCWDRVAGVYDRIYPAVKEYDPDIVYVQHEYGSFNNAAGWNALIGHLSASYRTVVVLHSVYAHLDKLIIEAPCQEVIVHSAAARDALRAKGIVHPPIHVIPHGCITPKEFDVRHSTIGNNNVIFQFGFGFEYKGWDSVPDIIEGLRKEFPEVYYIGIFNMSKFYLSFHEEYYRRLMTSIEQRGLTGCVVLHKGFRTEEVIFSYMKQAKVNLFPYWNHHEWLVHGASGAVRLALASGTPTVVGNVPFFEEFRGYLPVCSSRTEYIEIIKKVLTDPAYAEDVRHKMAQFIEERTWNKVANWYLEVTPDKDWTAPPVRTA